MPQLLIERHRKIVLERRPLPDISQPQGEGLSKDAFCLFRSAEFTQLKRKRLFGGQMVGLNAQRDAAALLGSHVLPAFRQSKRQPEMCIGEIGLEPNCFPLFGYCLGQTALRPHQIAKIEVDVGLVGLRRQRSPVTLFGFRVSALLPPDDSEQLQGGGIFRCLCQHLIEMPLGFVQLLAIKAKQRSLNIFSQFHDTSSGFLAPGSTPCPGVDDTDTRPSAAEIAQP
ncbi:MAG TPA: hypothetical protein VNX86_02595 [Rhizomicrobium sp.]|nr:hypothetical protein [Rhizomicrobium sp.]